MPRPNRDPAVGAGHARHAVPAASARRTPTRTPRPRGPSSTGGPLYGRRAMTIRLRPGHGMNLSSRLQNQTVLSKILSTGLLMFFEPNTRLYAHHGGAPALLKL